MEKTTTITPEWRGLLGPMLDVLCNEDAPLESHQVIREQLFRMALAADRWNEVCPDLGAGSREEK